MNNHSKPNQPQRTFFSAEGMEIHGRNLSFARDEKFMSIFNNIAEDNKEKGKIWRLHVFLWAFLNSFKLDGDLIECGVWKGFCSSIATRYTNFEQINKTLYLFDTWDGISEDQIDKERLGVGSKFPSINDRYKGSENYEKYYKDLNLFQMSKSLKEEFLKFLEKLKCLTRSLFYTLI